MSRGVTRATVRRDGYGWDHGRVLDDERLATLVTRLRAAGCVYAEEEAELLSAEATSTGWDDDRLEAAVAARVAGHPLEQVVGWAELDGVRVLLDPDVFVPRRRSGLLVDLAARAAPHGGTVVDLCCGSGALGAAVHARRPDLEVWAGDVDPRAVACARRNLPPDRVVQGDLYAALPPLLRERVDVLVVNAPYVPTDEIAFLPGEARDHEPRTALDGGGDGLDVHRRVLTEAATWLRPGGVVLIEVTALQAPLARTLADRADLSADEVVDDERAARVVRAVRPARR